MLKTKDIDHKVVIKHFSVKMSLWTEYLFFTDHVFPIYLDFSVFLYLNSNKNIAKKREKLFKNTFTQKLISNQIVSSVSAEEISMFHK